MVSRCVFVLLVACGGGSGGNGDVTPFIGTYAKTSHTRATTPGGTVPCSTAGMPTGNAYPFFRIDVDSFFMDPDVVGVVDCMDAGATTCVDGRVTMRAGEPGLVDESANSQTGGGATCQLYFRHAEARLTGATIAIEVLDKFDAPNISSSECTLQRARALASSPDCFTVERWTGMRQ